jgi:putative transposase/transposase-like zinc-binding protein
MPAHTAGCSPEAPREDPGRPPWEVADVLRHYGDSYCAAYRVPPSHHKVMHDILVCRTAALGGHAEQCPQCGFERYAYNSCRNRHCPKCQTLTKAQWVADRQADLLPVPYFHCVCTLPHELNALVLANKRPLLTLLLRAASQTLLQFGRQNLGGQLGGIQVLHTWDQTLGAHFHVHCLVPGGALADNGTRWIPTHPRFLFPVHALSPVFRGKFLEALHSSTTMGTLVFPGETEPLATPEGFRRFIDQLYAKAWIVYAKQSMAGPGHVLDYLSRYTHRVAIANHRIIDMQDGQVRFTYRNRRQGNRVQTMTLEAHEFIRRFLLHVVPQGLQRMRHIGFLANRCKARALRQCRQLLDQPPDPPVRPVKSVAEWLWQLTGKDITRCPECGQGPLRRLPLPPLPPRHPSLPPIWDSS